MRTERFKVTGMTSPGSAKFFSRALNEMGGIRDVRVFFGEHEMITAPDKIKLAIQGAGYGT